MSNIAAIMKLDPSTVSAAEIMRVRPAPANPWVKKMMDEAAEHARAKGVVKADGKMGKGGAANYGQGVAGSAMKVSPYDVYIEEGFNLRDRDDVENIAHIIILAKKIAKKGLKKPIKVYYNAEHKCMFVTDGHCRLQAIWWANEHLDAKIVLVDVFLAVKPPTEDERDAEVFLANEGKRPSILEKANKVASMMDRNGYTHAQVADIIGEEADVVLSWIRSAAAISNDIRKLILAGKVSLSTALATLEASDHNKEKALHDIMRGLEISEAEGGKAMPRHIQHAKTGFKLPSARIGVSQMFKNNEVTFQRMGDKVLFAMDESAYRKFAALHKLHEGKNALPGMAEMEEASHDEFAQ